MKIRYKIRLFTLISILSYNEWDIPLPLIKEFIKELVKHVFRWEKLNFKHFGNFVHTTEFLALGKTVNIYINCLMFYPSKQHVKWKQVFKFIFNNDSMMNRKLNFSVTRNDSGHVLICLVSNLIFKSKLLRSSCRNEFLFNFC